MRNILLFIGFLAGHLHAEDYKIQLLLTFPRSVSTAFERSMMVRGDHKILHEPWISSYFYHHGGPDIFNEVPPEEIIAAKNYEEVKGVIYRWAKESPVFVKDLLWGNGFVHDEALLADPRVVLTLLLRNPAASIESFFVKGAEKIPLEELIDYTRESYRYDRLLSLAEKHHQLRGYWPIIIEAEDLCQKPAETLRSFCTQAGIDYIENALSWQPELADEWKHFANWHLDVAQSVGFFIPPRDISQEKFSKIPEQFRPQLEAIYLHQKPFYEKLKALKN